MQGNSGSHWAWLTLLLLSQPLGLAHGEDLVDLSKVRILKAQAVSLAFTSDSKRLFSSSVDKITVWDMATGEPTQTLEGHVSHVKALALSRDGKRLISGSWDDFFGVKIWDLKADTPPVTLFTADFLIHSVALSPNEMYFATGGREKMLKIWDFPSGKLRHQVEAHPRDIECVAFSPDSKVLASCGYDSEVKLWEAETGKPLRVVPNVGRQNDWRALAFSPDGKFLAMSGRGFRVLKEDGEELFNDGSEKVKIASLAWSPDGKLIATGGTDKALKLCDATTGKQLAALAGHNSSLEVVRFSPDGRWIATGAQQDLEIRLWPLTTPAAPKAEAD